MSQRLIAVSLILIGCAPGSGGPPVRNAPAAELPSAWTANPCVVMDSTAPTADTLYVMGAGEFDSSEPPASFPCAAARAPSGGTPPVVMSLTASAGVDLRELLDGVRLPAGERRPDVLVTRDAGVLEYAAGLAGYLTAALPWSATYVLVPARATSVAALPPVAERDALARDAVTVDSRGAAVPFPWLSDSVCAVNAAVPAGHLRPMVAYAAGDTTARQLAERIVSLAAANGGSSWLTRALEPIAPTAPLRIVAVPADSIIAGLAGGGAVAAVLSVARDPRTPCATAGDARVPAGAIPLVDTRAHVLVRRGSGAAFLIAADGSLHFFRHGAP